MARKFPVLFARTHGPAKSRNPRASAVRIGCEPLEDRTAPALFNVGSAQFFSGINNNGFVTSGDWDDNGNRDIVVTNYGDGSTGPSNITFLYGKGNGSFGSATTLSVGPGNNAVSFLAVGLVNDDEFEDIVTCQTNLTNQTGTITVMLGTDIGAFQPQTPIPSGGNRPAWVGIADVTGDTKQDVVVVHLGETSGGTGRNFVVFKGDKTGALTNHYTESIALADGVPLAAAIAKINTDAVLDIAVTFANVPPESTSPQVDGSVKVYPGVGDGSFSAGTSTAYGSGGPLPIGLTAADIDVDGDMDLVTACAGDPDVNGSYAMFGDRTAVGYLRNSGGNFGPTTPLTLGLTSAFDVSVADLNNDGKPDLASANYGHPSGASGSAVVYMNNGKTGGAFGFVADADSPYSTKVNGAQRLVIDNFNSNPTPDIVVVHALPFVVTLLNTTTALAASTSTLTATPNPSEWGQKVTLTAKVTGAGTPTGMVTFFDNGVQIGTPQTLTNVGGAQQASLDWTTFSVATHPITAKYSGDGTFNPSTSNQIDQVVNPAATMTGLTGTPGPVTYGSQVTFTATVTSANLPPPGMVEFYEGLTKLGSEPLADVGGKQMATFKTTTLLAGSHSVVAKYVATTNFAASASAPPFVIQVDPAGTTVTVSSAPSPSSFTEEVTITAVITSPGGAPTGMIDFYDDGAKIGSGAIGTVGGMQVATFKTTALQVGVNQLEAKFTTTGNFAGDDSGLSAHTVNPIVTTVTVSGTPSPSAVTQSVTFTAVVGSASGAATGMVEFYIDGGLVGTKTISTVGGKQVATFDTAGLAVGDHTVVTKYTGTTGFAPDDSDPLNHTVTLITTTVSVSAAPSPSQFTQTVTLTAVVGSAFGAATGMVDFYDDGAKVGSGPISTVGGQQVATFQTAGLQLGANQIVAKYTGVPEYAADDSDPVTHTVNPITTTVTVSADPSPSLFTQNVTLTAVVGSALGAATGMVDFYDDGAKVGSGPISTVGGQQVATFQTAGLQLGANQIVAKYAATGNFAGDDSDPATHTVNPIPTSVTVSGSPNPVLATATVTFTAVVGSALGAATGMVEFYEGGFKLGTGPIGTVGGQQVATFQTAGLGLGSRTITAKYVGTTGYTPSQGDAAAVQVNPIPTTVTVSAAPSPSLATQTVTLTAVVGSALGAATGTVDFYDDGAKIGSGTLATVGGQQVATFQTTALQLGGNQIAAKFAAAGNFAADDSDPVTHTVNPITTTVSVSAAPNPSLFTQGVTLTAVVGSALGAATGMVDFYDDGAKVGSGPISTVGGQQVATFQTAGLQLGANQIVAKYAAAGNFAADDSDPVTHTVNPITTTVTVTSAGAASVYGQPMTLTAAVAAPLGSPSGTVTFFIDGAAVGTGTLAPVGGQQVATFQANGLNAGARLVEAKYAGTTGYVGDDSGTVTQTVNPAATALTLDVSAVTPAVGQPVTLTAKVSSPAGAPAGDVAFFDNGVRIGTGTLAAVGGQQVATFQTTALGLGSHQIEAKYATTGNFAAAAAGPVGVTVGLVATTVALATSQAQSFANQPVTFTATVGAAFGTPTGTVTFLDGGNPIGTGTLAAVGGQQVATFTTSALAVGSHPITARFEPSATFAGSASPAVTQQVTAGTTTVNLSADAGTSLFTQPVTFTARLDSTGGSPAGAVTFLDGTTVLGTGTLATVNGQQVATFTTSALSVGEHTITARFPGAGPAAPGTSPGITQVVARVPMTVALTVSPEGARVGTPVTLTATVTPAAGTTVAPTAPVVFRAGSAVLGSVRLSGTTATLVTTALPAGTTTVTAGYEGDTGTAPGSASVTATMIPVPPVVLLGSREFGVGAGAGFPGVARFFNPDGSERYSTAVFAGFDGGVRVTSADFNGDGIADLVAGSGPGTASLVLILDGKTKAELFRVNPYEPTFVGGVYVAAGDVSGDGVPDLAISPDEGGGPRVRMFSGAGFGQIVDFFGIDDPAFRGGARVAVGDVDGDGVGDLVVSAGFLGGPRVAGFSGKSLSGTPARVFADFFAFEQTLRNGAFVAVGDLDGDGKAEVIGGGGPSGGPRVTAYSGTALGGNRYEIVANFFGGNPDNRGGIRIVARNLDGDQFADLVTGDGTKAGSRVTGYLGKSIRSANPPEEFAFDAYPGFDGGVYVG